MLFSSLVDADFLDTEAFMAPQRARLRHGREQLLELPARFDSQMASLRERAPDTPVNRARRSLLRDSLEAALHAPGLFSMTAPTGSGKTLAATGFALHHAVEHGKRRVVYAIPYTSIIEQTAEVLRGVLGDGAVVEHHSNLDPSQETARTRVAAENWDAPIVVTTTVQLFESLFAARPSRCRKLHRLANSVVVLDEAQMLPADFLGPVLHVLRELTGHYGATVVLTTATQPALESRDTLEGRFWGLDGVREIVGDPQALHETLRRVDLEMPSDLETATNWMQIASALGVEPSALCIVNTRADARALHELMPPETFHLSTYLCGAHRSEVLRRIRLQLERGEPTRVVSTQVVEAGVDLDFPVVYRALAGLDSIAQAAGRCNREGRLESGRVVVFVPPTPPPPGHLRQARDAALTVLRGQPGDAMAPSVFRQYFRELFWRKGPEGLDRHGILDLLRPNASLAFRFRTAAERFQMIDDRQQSLVVSYGEGAQLVETLRRQDGEFDRALQRRLQRFTVNMPHRVFESLEAAGHIQVLPTGIAVQADAALYDQRVGVRVELGEQ